MSYQFAGFAGSLVVLALATPHLGGVVSPMRADPARAPHVMDAAPPALRFVVVTAAVPAGAEAAPPRVISAPAYSITATSDLVFSADAKTPDFDPEHPPADMGEPG